MKRIDANGLRDFLNRHNVAYREKSVTAGTELDLDQCPFNAAHVNGDSRLLIFQNGQIIFKCHHNSCKGKTLPDFLKFYEPDFYKDDAVSDFSLPQKPTKQIAPAISAAELLAMEIPPMKWIVRDMLPEGLAVLFAPPKTYKSFLCLDLMLAVSAGLPFLGFQTEQATCLYLDLESSERRPKERISKILQDYGPRYPREALSRLKISPMYSVNRNQEAGYDILGEGFEEELQKKIDENPGVKLVVIDVLQKIKPAGKRNQNAYEADYATLGALSKIALSNELCVLLVHHTKKSMDAGDWTNNASGSTAMTGAVDTSMSITREKRSDTEATLHVTGRDIKPQDLVINWDKNALRWRMEGTQAAVAQRKELEEYHRSPVVHTIKGLVNGGGGEWSGTVSELIGNSHYYKKIFFSPAQTGKEISRWEMLLSFDGYSIESSHTKKGTTYTFKLDTFDPTGREEEEGEYVL